MFRLSNRLLSRTIFPIFVLLCTLQCCYGQVLTPPYFNLAQGRRIAASSTCGEDVPEPELFCKLVGANAEGENVLIQGQVCDHCDPRNDSKKHPAQFAVDGRETWWQSPPLSRGMKYNQVNLTIDLGQEFHVAYVIIKMGNSPRPGVWALERSNDNGVNYFPWQYFADNQGECMKYFGNITTSITADDSVICDTQYSKIVPLEGGEIVVPLVQNRPSASDFFNSTILQEWTRATNVRFRLLRVKNLLGHLMSVARQDPTTTRRYFYSIKDISIGGRCRCNGHAETCTETDENDPYKLICDCKDNTCGHNCEMCCPGFEQKKWSQSKTNKKFVCERCNCFGHSDQCQYNETVDQLGLSLDIHGNYEGGGVCSNCQHFTEGINCHKCIHGYFRPYGKYPNETDACQPCRCDYVYSTGNCEDGTGKCECKPEYTKPNCDSCSFGHYGYPLCRACECYTNGTYTSQCSPDNGRCFCKPNYGGDLCRNCSDGFYSFPECKTCDCNSVGSLSNVCNVESGDCKCKSNFGGRTCDQCNDGYYQFPSCLYCNCDVIGTLPGICNKANGQCLCKPGYGGPRCDQCLAGYTGFPDCKPCNCSTTGSAFPTCDIYGKCTCLNRFAGKLCDQCSPGYYLAPQCLSCNCDPYGTNGASCDTDGNCLCKNNFDGQKCNRCKDGYYNYPVCEECNFDPAGVTSTFTGCRDLVGETKRIECKTNVEGKICNTCKDLYWNLRAENTLGCEECNCNRSGTLGRLGVCDMKSGQCTCKSSVSSRKCDQCSDGWYNLTDGNLFGCTDCNCDSGGSQSNVCNKQTGQCACLPRIGGRNCKEPIAMHYFPTLYQYQFEVEDGRTPAYTPVRYGFDEKVFPGYSWKGYAVYSHLQNETIHPIVIDKSSLYRIVLRYINFNPQAVTGTISAVPEYNSNIDVEQKFQVVLKPTTVPAFVTVAGISGNMPSPFVLNPGPWIIKIKTEKNLFLDYFVLLPAEYYEGSTLVSNVTTPCTLEKTDLCRMYLYPNISSFDQVKGAAAFISANDNRSPVQEYYDELEKPLGIPKMPKISRTQQELYFNLILARPGKYVFVVNYGTVANQDTTQVQVQGSTQRSGNKGIVTVYPCRYRTLCRQVVSDKDGRVAVWELDSNNVNLILKGVGEGIGIDSLVAIPLEQWSLDYVKPKPSCVINDTRCVPSIYQLPPDSKQFDFKVGNEKRISKILPSTVLDNNTELVYLDDKDSTVDITGKVPKPGPYTFIVHYYQPDHPDFDGTGVIHNGQMYDTKVRLHHCPGVSGCRSVVKQQNGNNVFQLTENFVFSLTARKGVWVQYILLIPSDRYTDEITTELPFDQTVMFISKCGQNHFHLDTSQEGFCKEATFSLTSKYNHGALACRCDWDGSLSFECEKFGGQCPCRDNVIGKRCDNCKTGYFGFPNCRSCNCSSTAVCDPNTGDCICPQNVIGEKCNQCQAYTYGFDPIIGCEDCNCAYQGVENNNLQCDLFTGACKCMKNIEGRTCDRCVAGFYAYPHCVKCTCDLRGTTDEICNQTNAACLCKSNVQGTACDLCKDGTFNLQRDDPAGCTQCFCFGRTSRCSSSTLFLSAIISYENWTLANVNIEKTLEYTKLPTPVDVKNGGISVNMGYILETPSYFIAPEAFVGNKLSAYGGSFNYTVHYTSTPDRSAIAGPDLILFSDANTFIQYTSVAQPDSNAYFPISVKMVETEFLNPASEPVSREDFMLILQNLTAIFVKASYVERGDITELVGISFEIGVPEYSPSSGIALAVEQCHCPSNYVGLSCEECADGYYRSSTGLFGGNCIPCQCNGHAATCDKATGVCIDCKHNTKGDHCEKCEMGYYGNSTVGSPNDCLICACPLPIHSNNFATGCDISESGDRIICDCVEGYTGDRCDRCAPGYYGNPSESGSRCVPCQCNGNINASEVNSCHPITGQCLKCLNNTSGDSCERCAPGYYGDALKAKDCQLCNCDTCGTKECDHRTGQCTCYENIVGEKCDRCADNHYGFTTCAGCRACNCANASLSSQCDDLTGYCRCKDGVVGQTCDRCTAGYWKYTENGCTSCGCNIGYSIGVGCNTTTGLCQCLPGVVGDKCDTCPYRSVLIQNEGCFTCDNCTHGLLDVTDQLHKDFEPVYTKFPTIAEGFFTSVRLTYINDIVGALTPNVSDVVRTQFDLTPYENKINSVKREKDTSLRKIQSIYNDLASSTKKINDAKMNALDVEFLVYRVEDRSRMTVHDIESLFYNLDTGTGPQTNYAITEGKMILQRILDIDIDDQIRTDAETAQQKAIELLAKVGEFGAPMNKSAANLEIAKKSVEKLLNKLEELQNYTEQAQSLAVKASNDNQADKKAKLLERINSLKAATSEAEQVINDASKQIENVTQALSKSKPNYEELSQNFMKLKEAKEEVERSLKTLGDGINLNRAPVFNARTHAEDLERQAATLNSIIKRNVSDHAVLAANSYKDIANALGASLQNATDAQTAANSTEDKLQGIDTKVRNSNEKSSDLLESARTTLADVQQKLSPELTDVLQKQGAVSKSINQTVEKVDNLKKSIEKQKAEGKEVKNLNADDATNKATNMMKDTKNIAEELPGKLTQAKELYSKLDDTRKSAQQIGSYLNQIEKQDPEILTLMNKLKTKPDELKVKEATIEELLKTLKQKITITGDLAAKIKVGMSLNRNTAVELPIPPSMLDQGSSNVLSLYFKSGQRNGLLLYVGNEANSRRKRDTQKIRRPKTEDFLALEIENGYLLLTSSLGERFITNLVHNRTFVADNRWYKVEIMRIGKRVNLTLTVQESPKSDRIFSISETGYYPGQSSVLNLDKDHSKFYIGGLPSTFEAPKAIKTPTFSGQVEELTVDGVPVGLWNFVSVSGGLPNVPINSLINGAIERDVLLPTSVSKGCRFSDGYVVLQPTGISLLDKSEILLSFKTTALNGLIFLAYKDTAFISIDIRLGFIYFQFNIGNGLKSFHTPTQYNDDQWHKISANRRNNKGDLIIDDVVIRSETSDDRPGQLQTTDYFYVGGYPGDHKLSDVVKDRFEGCIDILQINDVMMDLNNNLNSHGIISGCPDKFTRFVSFEEGSRKYIRWPSTNVAPDDWSTEYPLSFSLRIKTLTRYGLIAYGTDGKNSFALTLSNGSLVFKIGSKPEVTTGPNMKYNDDRWHSVMALHDGYALHLIIDDFDTFKSEIAPSPITYMRGNVYFGSVPSDIDATAAIERQFVGSLGDATLNGIVINLDRAYDRDKDKEPQNMVPSTTVASTGPSTGTSTPPPVTTTPPSAVTVAPGCLPLIPANDPDITKESGNRFGTTQGSFVTYEFDQSKLRGKIEYMLELKTASTDGIIFYVTEPTHKDYVTLYLKESKLHFSFVCGSSSASVTSEALVNEGEWHTIEFTIDQNRGLLKVDQQTQTTSIGCSSFNIAAPYYLGGVDVPTMNTSVMTHLQGFNRTFVGCLRKFTANSVEYEKPTLSIGVVPCSSKVEAGTFFPATGGYLKAFDQFKVGKDLEINLDIKPRNISGVLLGVHAKKYFLVLQMINGAVKLTVDSGNGPFYTIFKPQTSDYFCDDRWHSIKALKSKSLVILTVDGNGTEFGTEPNGIKLTNTNNPLYVGGYPPDLSNARGIETNVQYVGCMRNLQINGQNYDFSSFTTFGSVMHNVCPTI